MYINLGNIKLNYYDNINSNFLIFSEVTDSTMSFNSPVLISTKEELDIWFGKNFSYRSYLLDLIDSGVTLFLYKPISTKGINIGIYLDTDNYKLDTSYTYFDELPKCGGIKYYIENLQNYYIWYNESWTNIIDLPKLIDTTNYKIDLTYKNLEDLPSNGGIKYYIQSENKYYIWTEDQWIDIMNLPQNLDNKSESLNNRDTLLITKPTFQGPKYCHPEYKEGNERLGVFTHGLYDVTCNLNLNSDNLSSGKETLAFKYKSDNNSLDPNGYTMLLNPVDNKKILLYYNKLYDNIDKTKFEITQKVYKTVPAKITISSSGGTGICGWTGISETWNYMDFNPEDYINKFFYVESKKCYYTVIKNNMNDYDIVSDRVIIKNDNFDKKVSKIKSLNNIKTQCINYGYSSDNIKDKTLIIYNNLSIDSNISQFTTYADLEVSPDFRTTQNILTQFIKDDCGVEIWSKTIGCDSDKYDDSRLIKVLIEKSDEDLYRFTISRYDYEEVFEGYLFPTTNEDRLDYIITKNSKLINCKFYNLRDKLTQRNYQYNSTGIKTEKEFSFETKTNLSSLLISISKSSNDYTYVINLTKDNQITESFTGSIFSNDISELEKDIKNNSRYTSNFSIIDSIQEGTKTFIKSGYYTFNGCEFNIINTDLDKITFQNVTIHIIKLDDKNYTIEIIKGSNIDVESFTNSIIPKIELEEKVNRYSNIIKDFKLLGLCKSLRLGEFYLRGAEPEDLGNKENYLKSMQTIFNSNEDIKLDYFLIPNIINYIDITKLDDNYNYFTEYVQFNTYAKENNCQFLIQNNKILDVDSKLPNNPIYYGVYKLNGNYWLNNNNKWVSLTNTKVLDEIYNSKGDFIFNYLEKDNYLLYFYKSMIYNGGEVPGYYLYINSLLNNTYSMLSRYLIYDSPIENPYNFDSDIEKLLKKYKSNFLTYNNYQYYYKEYFNGDSYNTTGWMRFSINKVNIELTKNKWNYLGQRQPLIIRKNINYILDKIKRSFSIIKTIDIKTFSIDLLNNKLDLTISTYVNDLLNNNINLDITINYKTE